MILIKATENYNQPLFKPFDYKNLTNITNSKSNLKHFIHIINLISIIRSRQQLST